MKKRKTFDSAIIGDKVWSSIYGKGEIVSFHLDSKFEDMICVRFSKRKTIFFGFDGKYCLEHKYPSLFWKKQKLNFNTKKDQ